MHLSVHSFVVAVGQAGLRILEDVVCFKDMYVKLSAARMGLCERILLLLVATILIENLSAETHLKRFYPTVCAVCSFVGARIAKTFRGVKWNR